jgi:hypothetical protein
MTRLCTVCKQIMGEKCARCGAEATPLKTEYLLLVGTRAWSEQTINLPSGSRCFQDYPKGPRSDLRCKLVTVFLFSPKPH